MNDGNKATVSSSGNWYIHIDEDNTYHFYTLEKEKMPHLSNYCEDCDEKVISYRPGHFNVCSCGKVGVDTDRWLPNHGRYIGNIPKKEDGSILLEINKPSKFFEG